MIKKFIIDNLLSIHSGGMGGKIWGSIKLAAEYIVKNIKVVQENKNKANLLVYLISGI